MNAEFERRIASLFQAAIGEPPAARAAFVAAACGADGSLRDAVLALLAADESGGKLLSRLPLSEVTAAAGSGVPAGFPGGVIAGYDVVREIHRGGQGVVFLATHKTTRRKVAIKVMREGPFAGSADKARFDREVQVLGQLEHPNIVTIHDTGVAAGCDYFVMDYIAGEALDAWMAVRSRTIDETLRLFARICAAVNAAHLRGVIHRDLKPGNIRVDSAGEPHILDFGLAKVGESFKFQGSSFETGAIQAASTVESSKIEARNLKFETRNYTETGQFVGSLPWAAPEQAEGQPSKIDVRTDVYSLGVVLYQMLTGGFPYSIVGNLHDVLERILRAAPARPSSVGRRINNEVETIVLKCLQKERERRYQSAGDLGRDVQRYLDGEPIEAKRDSFAYVIRKHLRRHLAATVAVGTIVALVVSGGVATTVLWRQAATARDATAVAYRGEARQVAVARAVNGFLQEMLAAADPALAGERQGIAVRDVLDGAARRLDSGELRDEPIVEAGVRFAIGRTYQSLGLLSEADLHLQRALELRSATLGADHLETAAALTQLGLLRMEQGATESAEELHQRALRIVLAASQRSVADEARIRNNLGSALWLRGRLDEAAREFQHAELIYAALPPSADVQRDRAACRNNCGALTHVRGRLADAEREYRAALNLRRALATGPHPDVANSLQNLAAVLADLGRAVEAEAALREAEGIGGAVYAPQHPALAGIRAQLARLLREQGRDTEAMDYAQRAQAAFDLHPGQATSARAESRNGEGHLLWNAGRVAEAEVAFREALAIYQSTPAVRKRDVAIAMNNLAGVLCELQYVEEAARLVDRALRLVESPPAEDDLTLAAICHSAALISEGAGDASRALPLAESALRMRTASLPAEDWRIGNTRSLLGGILGELDRSAEAEPHLLAGYAALAAGTVVPQRFREAARQRLVRFYDSANRPAEAQRWRESVVSVPRTSGGP